MLTTSAESIAEAISCGYSHKSKVAFACMASTSTKATKAAIASGRIKGIEFPDESQKADKRTVKGGRKVYTDAQRRKIVKAIDERRDAGDGLMAICCDYGIQSKTYGTWKKRLKVGKKYSVSSDQHDQAILDLVNEGMSITEACGKFGVCGSVWGQRTIRNGLREPVNKVKMTKEHVRRIKQVQQDVEDGSSIVRALEKRGLTQSQYYRYLERMNFTHVD